MEHRLPELEPEAEGIVNGDWQDHGDTDSPTTGSFEAIAGRAESRRTPDTIQQRLSLGSSGGSSWSSSRFAPAPSPGCLSFQSNRQFQLSAPPSKKSSMRSSVSTASSQFSFSAAQHLASAHQAARQSIGSAAGRSASAHRESLRSMAASLEQQQQQPVTTQQGPQPDQDKGKSKEKAEETEQVDLTPAQEFM